MGTELVPITSARAIMEQLPTIGEQYDYHKKLAALSAYTKDRDFYVAMLEAQVAMAETLPKAMERGDVSAVGSKYSMSHGDIHNQMVNRWRQLAEIPAKARQRFYAEVSRPSSAALRRWWKEINTVHGEMEPGDLAGKLYSVILADPPWRYEHSKTNGRKIENQYKTMDLDEICALDVPAAKNCVLYLWVTNPKLVEGLQVIDSWGFKYKTNLVWVKHRRGMGYWLRQRHELLLIATKGSPRPPNEALRRDSVLEAKVGRHSAKPIEVYEMIEATHGKAARIELFARTAREGWDCWGNQAPRLP